MSESMPRASESGGLHLDLRELLILRDGADAVPAEVVNEEVASGERPPRRRSELLQHLDDCAGCRDRFEEVEQTRAGLIALDEIPAPEGLWNEIAEQITTRQASRSRRRRGWTALLAAALLGACLLGPLVLREVNQNLGQRRLVATMSDQLIDMQEQSALLELELQDLTREPRVLSGRQASAMVTLEDALDLLDRRLTSADLRMPEYTRVSRVSDHLDLWRRRIELQVTLVELHFDPVTLYDL